MMEFLSQIDLLPNWTFFLQLLIFVLVYFVLKSMVFIPYIKLVEFRYLETIVKSREAEAIHDEIVRLDEQYRERLQEVRREGNLLIQKYKQRGSVESEKLIANADEMYRKELVERQEDLKKEHQIARKKLDEDKDKLCEEVMKRALG